MGMSSAALQCSGGKRSEKTGGTFIQIGSGLPSRHLRTVSVSEATYPLPHLDHFINVEGFAFLALKEEAMSFSLITKHSCTDRSAEHPPVSLTKVPKVGTSLLIDCLLVLQFMSETVVWSNLVAQRYLFSLYVQ